MYDPSLARFMTLDPLAESYLVQSPYVYAANNPILYIDYMGMGPWSDFWGAVGNGITNISTGLANGLTNVGTKLSQTASNVAMNFTRSGAEETVAAGMNFIDEVQVVGVSGVVSNAVDAKIESVTSDVETIVNDPLSQETWEIVGETAGWIGIGFLTSEISIADDIVGTISVADDIVTKRVSSKTLRKKWEKSTGKEWPKEPGNSARNQSVSHKKALVDGGTNQVKNLEPKPWKEHQKMHKENGDFKRWAQKRRKK